jgi:hypothetical protein
VACCFLAISILCCLSVSSSYLIWFSFLNFSSSSCSYLILSFIRLFSLCSARTAFLSSIGTASSSSSGVSWRADFAAVLAFGAAVGSVKSIKSLLSLTLAASRCASTFLAYSLATRSLALLSFSLSSCSRSFWRASCTIFLLSAWSRPKEALLSENLFYRNSFLFTLSSLI